MTTRRTALLVGATGLIGSHLKENLLHDDLYSEVVAWVRRPWDAEHPKLKTEIIDFDDLSEISIEAADVFCCLGTTIKTAGSQEAFRRVDYEYVVELARRAAESGVERFFVVSSIGADSQTGNFYLRVKGEMEEALHALDFTALHIFQPSLLLGNRQEFRFGERIGMWTMPWLNPLMVGGMRRYRAIDAARVALAMLGAAKTQESGICVHQYASIHQLARRAEV